ncbi:MAG: tRNA (N6-isopentenyl adenosine(37)-C2)-methylthiotransferase MiaB [Deferribacterota bacterium]|nr:tRNA (N6-isopentenyl adenosine(37)-C2)-methylthiotransferase MiaB [Deferribacterota bacterium]
MMTKFYIKTYGCQMNEYDSEYISSVLINKGYYETNSYEDADYIILNTCSVREKAEKKVYSEIGRIKKLKRKDREIKIGICGCVAQQQGYNIMERFKDVSFVVGTDALNRFEEIMNQVELGERIVDTDFKSNKLIKGKFKREPSTIAYVSIMKGCNNYCSYCIVPYVRGREISRDPEEILDEIKYLVELGYKEVILLGQNVNSYGKTLDETINFPKFLSMVNNINGLERIRFVTSHPKDFDEDLIFAMRDNEKVCEQIHLPIQSGSNKILKSMNRKYTSQEYLKKIEKLKKYIPNIAISSDFIVGYPGESEGDFNDTLNILNEVKYIMYFLLSIL